MAEAPVRGKTAGELAEAAAAAYDAFQEARHAMFGMPMPAAWYGEDPDWPVFLDIAAECARRGWNPSDYVHKTMYGRRHTHCPLSAAGLLTPSRVRMYRDGLGEDPEDPVRSRTERIEEEYRACVSLLIQRETSGATDSERDLLMSPASSFPAWFRVAYPEHPDEGLEAAWGALARREVASVPGLAEFLRRVGRDEWLEKGAGHDV